MRRLAALTVLAAAALGCEPKETDTGLCREVYGAYCDRAFECDAIDELHACQVYYYEDCRVRRLQRGVAEPSAAELEACVAAIAGMSCEELDPTALPECPFLVQPLPDGGVDGDPADAGADADGADGADGG